MATIDYKEKYEQAMERARQYFEKPYLEDSAWIVGYIFPELKESKGDMIRKRLTEYFEGYYDGFATDRNHANVHWEGLEVKEILAWLEKQAEQKLEVDQHSLPVSNDSDLPTFDESIYHPGTEKTYEQKPDDKVEPKFKVGNKIKLAKEPEYPAREIIAIQNDAYYFDEAIYLPFSRQDEWELVEQKPAETEKGTKGNNGEIPNSDWSEEDENRFRNLIYLVEHSDEGKGTKEGFVKFIYRLKSLRPQNQWKPSDEQMYNLSEAAHCDCVFFDMEILKGLYDELKKL